MYTEEDVANLHAKIAAVETTTFEQAEQLHELKRTLKGMENHTPRPEWGTLVHKARLNGDAASSADLAAQLEVKLGGYVSALDAAEEQGELLAALLAPEPQSAWSGVVQLDEGSRFAVPLGLSTDLPRMLRSNTEVCCCLDWIGSDWCCPHNVCCCLDCIALDVLLPDGLAGARLFRRWGWGDW